MGEVMAVRGAPARRRVGCKLVLLASLLALVLANGPAMAEVLAPSNPIGVHSMLYLTHSFSAKQAMFEEASAVGASTIRLDIELSGVFPDPNETPDWSDVDQYMWLAELYHVRVLADLVAPPWYEVDCPPGTPPSATDTCPPANSAQWGAQVGMIAAHTRGVINYFEIVNEPDGRWAFLGSPEQYAAMLQASYDAIHAANPRARVALGGLMNIGAGGLTWMNAMLATPGTRRPPQIRHRQHPRPYRPREGGGGRLWLAPLLCQARLHGPPVGHRNRVSGRSNPPNLSRLPGRGPRPSPLSQCGNPRNDPRRRGKSVCHRA